MASNSREVESEPLLHVKIEPEGEQPSAPSFWRSNKAIYVIGMTCYQCGANATLATFPMFILVMFPGHVALFPFIASILTFVKAYGGTLAGYYLRPANFRAFKRGCVLVEFVLLGFVALFPHLRYVCLLCFTVDSAFFGSVEVAKATWSVYIAGKDKSKDRGLMFGRIQLGKNIGTLFGYSAVAVCNLLGHHDKLRELTYSLWVAPVCCGLAAIVLSFASDLTDPNEPEEPDVKDGETYWESQVKSFTAGFSQENLRVCLMTLFSTEWYRTHANVITPIFVFGLLGDDMHYLSPVFMAMGAVGLMCGSLSFMQLHTRVPEGTFPVLSGIAVVLVYFAFFPAMELFPVSKVAAIAVYGLVALGAYLCSQMTRIYTQTLAQSYAPKGYEAAIMAVMRCGTETVASLFRLVVALIFFVVKGEEMALFTTAFVFSLLAIPQIWAGRYLNREEGKNEFGGDEEAAKK